MVSEPREKKKNLIISGLSWINSGKPFSDHVSFRSPFPSPKAFRSTVLPSKNPHRRQKTLTAGNFFRRSPFPTPTIPSGAQGGDLQVLSKHWREILIHVPSTSVSSPTREGAWRIFWPRLTPSSHPPFVLVPSEPCKCIFLGFFVSTGPLNSLSDDLRWLPLHPEPCTCLTKSAISRIRALFNPNVFHSPDK